MISHRLQIALHLLRHKTLETYVLKWSFIERHILRATTHPERIVENLTDKLCVKIDLKLLQ